ncbi:MAG: hypothetical protein RL266_2269, partial [Bacteroidota bacterium]
RKLSQSARTFGTTQVATSCWLERNADGRAPLLWLSRPFGVVETEQHFQRVPCSAKGDLPHKIKPVFDAAVEFQVRKGTVQDRP